MAPAGWRSRVLPIVLGVLAATTAGGPSALGARPVPPERPLPAGVHAVHDPSTGRLTWLSGTDRHPVATSESLGSPRTAIRASSAYLAHEAGRRFGVADPLRSLRPTSARRDATGRTFVRYQQTYRGLPVVAGELVVQVGADRDIVSVSGRMSPGLSLSIAPRVSAARARQIAVAATAAQEKVRARNLRAGPATLSVYDPALAGDPRRLPGGRLAWRIDVTGRGGTIREFAVIDAIVGSVLATFNQVETSAPPAHPTQRVCDLQNTRQSEPSEPDRLQCDPGDTSLVADPVNSGIPEVVAAFQGADAAYGFYAKRFGRNSLDGQGLPLISTVRYCPSSTFYACPYDNAMWNGVQMVYGAGFARADDIVAHELTHGVTGSTSELLYWFQSGAINESLSDIFGELVDLTDGLGDDTPAVRWLVGEDIPTGSLRNMADPTVSAVGAQPDRMTSSLYWNDPFFDDRGGVHYNSGVGNKAAFLMVDGGTFNGQTISGLGIDKAAALWYRVETRLLTSGSDYSDLAAALRQACKDLIGTTPKNGDGTAGSTGRITAADCTQVGRVITATEMTKPAFTATVKHAPLCAAGKTPTAKPLFDRIAANGAGWTAQGTAGIWEPDPIFTTSKPVALWGSDTVPKSSVDASERSRAVAIPATGRTYLAFRHYVGLQQTDPPIEGGVVEYATAPGGPWKDLGSRFTFNGYNGRIAFGYGNRLEGRRAFVGLNYGFAVSKADVTFLKGKRAYFRFRLATNSDLIGFDGWAIDDVRVYQCT